ncbi:MAG TPA: hypothetical protein VJG90_02590 [Candidatus Nanoarchaeia archaeon]|nr:hypothetical protein [Candidatus Nanoarchaeia archaeon]
MHKILLVFLALLPLSSALTIQGVVYNFELNPTHAIVEINTTPHQVMVAKNGTYRFNVPPGSYHLHARHAQNSAEAEEEILTQQEGKYTVDLILFPQVDEDLVLEENDDLNDLENVLPDASKPTWPYWLIGLALLLFLLYFIRKPKTSKEIQHLPISEELHAFLTFIEQQGGRTTQKNIRKQFNYSEAKISLMLDELEAKRMIQRIKKGRGNIIVKK